VLAVELGLTCTCDGESGGEDSPCGCMSGVWDGRDGYDRGLTDIATGNG